MGSGPFVFVEHVQGSHVHGRRNPDYFDKGKPYLDSFRAVFITDTGARVAAVRGGRALIEFRGFSPKERDDLVRALGSKITVQESPWDCMQMIGYNHEKKPFDDKRVRKALSLAVDRYEGSRLLSPIASLKEVAGVQVPGTPFATPPDELAKLAGYGRDPEAARNEARRLLKEAGVPNLSFVFTNQALPMPYEPLGIWLIDQWRKVGVTVTQRTVEPAAAFRVIRAGEYEVAFDGQCGYIVEPDLDLYKYLSRDKSPANYGRYIDRELDDLYEKQSRATNLEERKRYIRQFEKRLFDDEVHYAMTLQYHRIIPHHSKVKGWRVSPSHYINQHLDAVWIDE
jgi:peptide/nickel transport system substrate-binding protein